MSDARGQSCVRFATQLPIWEGRPPLPRLPSPPRSWASIPGGAASQTRGPITKLDIPSQITADGC